MLESRLTTIIVKAGFNDLPDVTATFSFRLCVFHVNAGGSHSAAKAFLLLLFHPFDPAFPPPITSGSDLPLPQPRPEAAAAESSVGGSERGMTIFFFRFQVICLALVKPVVQTPASNRPQRRHFFSSSRVWIRWNNLFLYGLVLTAPRCVPVHLNFQLGYCTGLWSEAPFYNNLKCSRHPFSAFTPLCCPLILFLLLSLS